MAAYPALPADCVSAGDVCSFVVSRKLLPAGVERLNGTAPFRLFASFLAGPECKASNVGRIQLLKRQMRQAMFAAEHVLGAHFPGSAVIKADAHVALWVSVMSLTRRVIPFDVVRGFFERKCHQMMVQTPAFTELLEESGVSWPPVDLGTYSFQPGSQVSSESIDLIVSGHSLVEYADIRRRAPVRAPAPAAVRSAPAAVRSAAEQAPARPPVRAPVAVRRQVPPNFGIGSGPNVAASASTVGSSSDSAFRPFAPAVRKRGFSEVASDETVRPRDSAPSPAPEAAPSPAPSAAPSPAPSVAPSPAPAAAILPAHMVIRVYPDHAVVPRGLFDQMYAAWMAAQAAAQAAAPASGGG